MNHPELFGSLGFSAGPGKRNFNPRPVAQGKKRVLARCRRKGCKFCKAVDLGTEARAYQFGGGTFQAISRGELAHARATLKCDTHPSEELTFEEIQGTHSDARECDPRCTGAIGPVCVCQCGGANHGGNWL